MPDYQNRMPSNIVRKSANVTQKRQAILEAAEKLFASKGFHQTTIADISEASGVHEASIFQYYKTKENLLVSIPESHLENTLEGIAEHLQGMKGAEPKLRKLVWHQLRDLMISKEYTSVLLRDLRTMPAFYNSRAYEMIRKYSAYAAEAIREGIREGDIIPDLEPILVLEMIFGAIDSLVLRWLFFDDPYDPAVTADEIFSLIKAAIWIRPPKEQDAGGRGEIRRRTIMRAAAEVFGSKGYAASTISEIAAKAGIAEASIYQYFKGKEDLLLSVPGTWFDELAEELERVFSGKLNPAERLSYLLRRWALDFQTREWETSVLILELYRNPAFYKSEAYRGTHRFWRLIRSVVEEGRQEGCFRKDFNVDYYMHLIQGAFEHEALGGMMLRKRKTSVVQTEHMISLLLRAVL